MTRSNVSVFVTVGMGRWPFDRLLRAMEPVARRHDVFAQSGTSQLCLTYPHKAFIDQTEFRHRLESSDVVVTHAGNTVRVVQRVGKVPIVVAREPTRGEVGNDHQVRFLRCEVDRTPMVVVSGELEGLDTRIDVHRTIEKQLIATRRVPPIADADAVRKRLEAMERNLTIRGPIAIRHRCQPSGAGARRKPLASPHLGLDCAPSRFGSAMFTPTSRPVIQVVFGGGTPCNTCLANEVIVRSGCHDHLPFASNSFASASMFGESELVRSGAGLLAEVHRVLRPGGNLAFNARMQRVVSVYDHDVTKSRVIRCEERFVEESGDSPTAVASGQNSPDDQIRQGFEAFVDLLSSAGFDVYSANATDRCAFPKAVHRLVPGRLRRVIDSTGLDGRDPARATLLATATLG